MTQNICPWRIPTKRPTATIRSREFRRKSRYEPNITWRSRQTAATIPTRPLQTPFPLASAARSSRDLSVTPMKTRALLGAAFGWMVFALVCQAADAPPPKADLPTLHAITDLLRQQYQAGTFVWDVEQT